MFQIAELKEIKGFTHGFSTMEDGNMGFRFGVPDKIVANRASFLRSVHRSFGPSSYFSIRPGDRIANRIAIVREKFGGGLGVSGPDGQYYDAAITDLPDLQLFLPAADCVMIFLYDPDPVRRAVALIHAGRQSSVRGVVERTLEIMGKEFYSAARDLIVGIGPAIRQRSYRLEYFEPVADPGSRWRDFCRIADGGVEVDLVGYNQQVLIDAGVDPRRIFDCGIDTFADIRFFSHRRSKATGEPEGRHACVVGMVPIE